MSERGGDGFQFEMNFSVSRFGVSLKNGIRLDCILLRSWIFISRSHDFLHVIYGKMSEKESSDDRSSKISLMLIVLTFLQVFIFY